MLFPKTEALLEQLCETSGESNAALWVQSETQTSKKFFGGATADSLFSLGELGQALCTISLLFVAESEDRLRFSDRIEKFFPDFPGENRTILDFMNKSGAASLSRICEPKISAESILQSYLLESLLEKLYGNKLSDVFTYKIASKLKLNHTRISELSTMEGPAMLSTLEESMLCFQHLLKQTSVNPDFTNSTPVENHAHFGLQANPGFLPNTIGISSRTHCAWLLEKRHTKILFLSEKISSDQITRSISRELGA